jgi:ankyrin repeat protein
MRGAARKRFASGCVGVALLFVGIVAFVTYRQQERIRLDRELIAAVMKGEHDAMRHSLYRGASPNARVLVGRQRRTFWSRLTHIFSGGDPDDYVMPSALILAADRGDAKAVRLLLENGADPNLPEGGGGTPLMFAGMSSSSTAVRLLLDAGANVNAKDRDGVPALQRAAVYRRAEAVRLLVERGADVNARAKDSGTAIIYAAREGSAEIVRFLLAEGADVNVVDSYDYSALRWAREQGHGEIVKLLRMAGAKH